MPEPRQLVCGGSIAQLRLVAEREQRLLAARGLPGACNGNHFIDGKIRPLVPARWLGKRTVMADIAAKLRERYEDLARVRDDGAMRRIPPSRRRFLERVEIAVEERQRLLAGEIAVEAEVRWQHRQPTPHQSQMLSAMTLMAAM